MCFTDFDDMGQWLTEPTEVTARKEHRCDDCGGPIAKGERHVRGTSLFDRHVNTLRRCARCVRIAAAIYLRERAEGCSEHESHPPYGEYSIAEYLRERRLAWDDERGEILDGALLEKWIGWMDLLFLPDDEDELPAVPA